jgi:hypothetical protein
MVANGQSVTAYPIIQRTLRANLCLAISHVLERQLVRRPAEVPAEVLDGADVDSLGVRRHVCGFLRIFVPPSLANNGQYNELREALGLEPVY